MKDFDKDFLDGPLHRKNKLSIGEMAKISGATIKQIRYYEKMGLLTPAFTDRFTNYRYYTLDQAYHIDLIRFCIEMDIPLKELADGYFNENGTVDYAGFLSYGKKIAREKISALGRRLGRIEDSEQMMTLARKYNQKSGIYKRLIPAKYFYCLPFKGSFGETDIIDAVRSFLNLGIADEEFGDFFEYGLLYEYSPKGVSRYTFAELTEGAKNENIKVIPGGTYFCKQFDASGIDSIERAGDIFTKQLRGAESFLAVETEVFNDNYKTGSADCELRVIPNHPPPFPAPQPI